MRSVAALLLLFVPVVAVEAQGSLRSGTSGFTIGAGLHGASLSTDVTGRTVTDNGGGAHLELGYGFNTKWTGFLGLYGSNIDAPTEYSLGQVDLGVRYLFRDTDKQARPYLEGALAARQFKADVELDNTLFSVKSSSGGLSFGGGVQIFFNPKFALDLGVNYSLGSFSDWEANGVSIPLPDIDATTTNARIGVRFWPSPR